MLIQLDQLSKMIGGRQLFGEASAVVRAGDRIGLVGPNGAGKTTLLRILAGDEPLDGGRLNRSRGVRVGLLRQEIDPTQTHSVRDEAAKALEHLDQLELQMREYESQMAQCGEAGQEIPPELARRYDDASTHFELGGGFSRESRVATVLSGLGFDTEACERPLSSFSGGWLMRVELAKLILAQPDVMLLDEPTNHLDLPAIQWFETELANFRGAVIAVSHDRTFLRRTASRIFELDGTGGFALYETNYDGYLAQRDERRLQLLARKANQDREIAQMERFVERFRAKATKARQAQSRIKALDRIERIEVDQDSRKRIRLRIPDPPRSGEAVMTLSQIHKSYAEKRVYEGVDLAMRRGERVALAGPNGAGKSTLLRIIAGTIEIDSGERLQGHNVEIAFFAQHQLESLEPGRTVLEEIESVALTGDYPRLRSHLGAFLFTGDDVEKRVSVLSGGEKARLALAKMLLHPANLLVLDEPTNHLDIEACEVLEEALSGFGGTLVFVSHDRSFINALATRVVEVQTGSRVREFIGNYDDYLRKLNALESSSPEAPEAGSAQEPQPAGARSQSQSQSGKPRETRGQRTERRERQKRREKLARRIAKLEEEIHEREAALEELTWKQGEPEIYQNPERSAELQEARSALEQEVEERYSDWERSTHELEAIDGAPS